MLLGYTAGSGPSNKALADLASYGLVERAGKGELRVTRRAQAILYPQTPAELKHALREAAFDPSLFQELRDRFAGLESPPEDGIATYLNRAGFNSNSIRPATRAYLATLAYLQQFGATESNSPAEEDAGESPSNNDGEGEREVFRNPPPPPPGQRRERQMAQGERVLTSGLMSRESTFEIIVTGRVGVKEIETLIRKLEIDKDLLADEDEATSSSSASEQPS